MLAHCVGVDTPGVRHQDIALYNRRDEDPGHPGHSRMDPLQILGRLESPIGQLPRKKNVGVTDLIEDRSGRVQFHEIDIRKHRGDLLHGPGWKTPGWEVGMEGGREDFHWREIVT